MTKHEAVNFLIKHPSKYGHMVGFTKLGEIHNRWIRQMVTAENDKTLQAHRGSYKTTCVSLALAILIVLLPNARILFIRKTDADIKEIIAQVRKILLQPQTTYLTQCIYDVGLRLVTDNSYEIKTNLSVDARGTAQLLGAGIGGSLTGKHFDIIFTDDIVNIKDRTSKAERERTRYIYQELQNIKNPGGRIFNTGTPWHRDDAFELMPEPEMWDCYSTGMLDEDQLSVLRKSMSPSLFAANYELRHIAAEDALFATPPRFTDDVSLLQDGIAHIDAAYGGEDYTAFTCGKRVGDTLYMYGQMWHSHFDTVLDKIITDCRRLKCGPIMCESNADKNFLAKEIMRDGYKARPYTEHENKYLKIAEYLRKWWGNIVWLEGTDRDYLAQIMDYTEDAEHDDAPDSAAVVCRWFDRRKGTKYESPFGG